MKNILAAPGKVIVKFRPYRRDGLIEIPDRHKPESCEAEIVHDSNGEWQPGLLVIVSTLDGTYWKPDEEEDRICTIKRQSVLMAFTEKDGKIETIRPLQRAVITTFEEPAGEISGFAIPSQFQRYQNEGKVLATGPGDWEFREGVTIYFERIYATKLAIDGKKALYVPEKLIYGLQEMAA